MVCLCENIVRVGSTARTFAIRNSEHGKCARQFYTRYPSKSADYSKSLRRGFFEDLNMFTCLGYDASDQISVGILCCLDHDRGILTWPGYMKKIQGVKFSGCGDNIKLKQLRMVVY